MLFKIDFRVPLNPLISEYYRNLGCHVCMYYTLYCTHKIAFSTPTLLNIIYFHTKQARCSTNHGRGTRPSTIANSRSM